jgi:tripartite-type tricarboxylate transporter receptor subunit TctC
MRISLQLMCFVFATLFGHGAWAQPAAPAWPSKQVRVIVPYPPGGPTDVVARVFSQKATETFGQNFYVENINGASGMIGANTAANAAPDGHTLIFVTNDYAVQPALTTKAPYDIGKSFSAVSLVATTPLAVITHPSVPAKTMQEMVALVRQEPGKHSYASMGIGSGLLWAESLFKLSLKLDIVNVPFQGAAPLITSVLGAHTPIGMIGLSPAAPAIADGQLRGLAITGTKRSPAFPDIPTLGEAGVPGQDHDLIIGLLAPGATPRPIIDRLQREVARVITLADVKKLMDGLGFAPVASSPEDYTAQIRADYENAARIMREAGLKFE